MVTTEQIKELRERTGISLAQCKKALEDSGGDISKALEALKIQGAEVAAKKANRTLAGGVVGAYIHSNGKMGAMVELHSETDFVANNPEFRTLVQDVAMHVAAMEPADLPALLAQPFIKDPGQTIGDLVQHYVQKFGERIEISRFARFDTAQAA